MDRVTGMEVCGMEKYHNIVIFLLHGFMVVIMMQESLF